MSLPTNHFRRRGHEASRHETHFSAVLGPRAPHGEHQLQVGQHYRPDLLRPHADDGRGSRFSLGTAVRSGDGQMKPNPCSVGLSRLISRAALAVMALVRCCSRLAHQAPQNRILYLIRLREARRELRSTDWIVSYGACHPALSEWPFPLAEGEELRTTTTDLGGLHEDSIPPGSPPVI